MLELQIRRKQFSLADGGTLEVLRDFTLQVGSDEFVCLVGPSGCGKTTTLRAVLGLGADFDGSVQLNGNPRVAAVFQEPSLLPWRSVVDNVRIALPRSLRDQSLQALFETLGLAEMQHFYPTELSLGLARRVALARAFALEPGLIVLDEPFVSLDDETARRLRQLLVTVWEARPTAALMVTHNLREAVELADRIVLLKPRPATEIAQVNITIPRDQRDAEFVTGKVAEINRIAAAHWGADG